MDELGKIGFSNRKKRQDRKKMAKIEAPRTLSKGHN